MAMPTFHLAPDLPSVSRLCLGTMTMGEQSGPPESLRLLDAAYDAGVNFFDSAEMYPVPQRAETHGRSEELVGRWLRARRVPRDSVVLATKVAGPSGQMTWIRGGPVALDSRNITEAIDSRISLLAYSPMAMGILSGKYHSSDDSGPPDARMNLFMGRYSEGESRYNLKNPKLESAVKKNWRQVWHFAINPSSCICTQTPPCGFSCFRCY
ncbi:protein tas isoform X3 [Triticum aestivum]|uniref:protein tas isoform X3 n=1 Tax=Triticum aestivum TaxID=4565 RepID=UPI001D01BFE7|nr:protein tas-like isoform X3 [Triticum aestivum]